MKETLAKLVTNILNPFLVSLVALTLLTFKSTPSVHEAIKWLQISIVLNILPVFLAVVYLIYFKKLNSFFDNPGEQRRGVYIFASVLGAVSCGILWYFKAPDLLKVTFTASLAAVVVFMVINFFWKISLHTAFIGAAATVLIIVYGAIAAWSLLFLPLVGWARLTLRQHSPAQVIVGALLAAVIVSGVFWGFGVVG